MSTVLRALCSDDFVSFLDVKVFQLKAGKLHPSFMKISLFFAKQRKIEIEENFSQNSALLLKFGSHHKLFLIMSGFLNLFRDANQSLLWDFYDQERGLGLDLCLGTIWDDHQALFSYRSGEDLGLDFDLVAVDGYESVWIMMFFMMRKVRFWT